MATAVLYDYLPPALHDHVPGLLGLGALLVGSVTYLLFRRRRWLSDLPGPSSGSWLYGHKLAINRQTDVGQLDFAWTAQYGGAFRLDDCFGGELLMVTDPAAVHHILITQGYGYPKTVESKTFTGLAFGRGVSWAGGETHVRHRKVLAPAFTAAPIRAYLPVFRRVVTQLSQNWRDALQEGDTSRPQNLNISRGLVNTTLDIIGETVFDYHFGSLDAGGQKHNEFSEIFHNLWADSNIFPPKLVIVFAASWQFWPAWLLRLVEHLPARQFLRFKQFLRAGKRMGKELIVEKAKSVESKKKHDDILSILVDANQSADPANRLDEDEILSQVTTLLFAGHETTATTLTWLIYELAHHPEHQERIRAEVAARRATFKPGQTDFSQVDFDALAFTNSCIKEALRYHPISPWVTRESAIHDVVPLSEPLVSRSGKPLASLELGPGVPVLVSTCAYNRLKSVWGDDADTWNPERFMDAGLKDRQVPIGLVANLLTFSAGPSGCIGWRFAFLEMQSTVVELLANFRFTPPSVPAGQPPVEMLRVPIGAIMAPMVKGKFEEKTQMPLGVQPLW